MKQITIKMKQEDQLVEFLELNEFNVEIIDDNVIKAQRAEELPVFISAQGETLYFEVEIGAIKPIGSEELYFKLLDLNTEILPVSFAINNSDPDNPALVLVESRIVGDLNDQELLSVFDALELALDKAESLLANYIHS